MADTTLTPDVTLDVVFEEGLLFFELANNGDVPATNVVCAFNRPVLAPDGVTEITSLRLFKKMPFLAPGKRIRVFVDLAASYFARKQPNTLRVILTWKQGGRAVTTSISHDLRVYRDLPYISGRDPSARRGEAVTHQTPRR